MRGDPLDGDRFKSNSSALPHPLSSLEPPALNKGFFSSILHSLKNRYFFRREKESRC